MAPKTDSLAPVIENGQQEAPEPPTTEDAEERAGRSGMNPELVKMGRCERELMPLDKAAQARVIAWLTARFMPARIIIQEAPPFGA